jgi:hypothetical protein
MFLKLFLRNVSRPFLISRRTDSAAPALVVTKFLSAGRLIRKEELAYQLTELTPFYAKPYQSAN